MRVGVLALQGGVIEHFSILEKLNANPFYIKSKNDIKNSFDGLILPGGESTAMSIMLNELCLYTPLKNCILDGMPVFGTCAGLILLSKQSVKNDKTHSFGVLDVFVKRNGYGRQLDSFTKTINFDDKFQIEGVFIRAPLIQQIGQNVQKLATCDDNVVAVRENNILASSFHPELTDNPKVHEYFLDMIKN